MKWYKYCEAKNIFFYLYFFEKIWIGIIAILIVLYFFCGVIYFYFIFQHSKFNFLWMFLNNIDGILFKNLFVNKKRTFLFTYSICVISGNNNTPSQNMYPTRKAEIVSKSYHCHYIIPSVDVSSHLKVLSSYSCHTISYLYFLKWRNQ